MHTLRAYAVHVTISFVICLDVVLRVFNLVANQTTWSMWQRRETLYKQSFRAPSLASMKSSVFFLVQSTIMISYPWMPSHFKELNKVSCQIVPFLPLPLIYFFHQTVDWIQLHFFFPSQFPSEPREILAFASLLLHQRTPLGQEFLTQETRFGESFLDTR